MAYASSLGEDTVGGRERRRCEGFRKGTREGNEETTDGADARLARARALILSR